MMPCAKREELTAQAASGKTISRGFSLVELLVTMVIFGFLMTGIFQAYIAQMKNTTREYGIAESDIDRSIGQGIISRDIFMAGYGLADDYNGDYTPWALQSTNSDSAPDDLTLMGTALGMDSQQAQHWSYVNVNNGSDASFTPKEWRDEEDNVDARENLSNNDMVVLIEPSTKRLLTDGSANADNWLFRYVDADDSDPTTDDDTLVDSTGANLNPVPNGTVLYGLYQFGSAPATQPFYAVRYYLSAATGAGCAPGVRDLLRIESRTTQTPSGVTARPLIPCVADFQVILGLDTNNDREIDLWKNGGVTAGDGYDPARLNRSLRQVRVYALTQIGERDNSYTYPEDTIYVGDESLGRGREFSFANDAQRHYRWRVIRFSAVPRNIR